MIQFLLSLPQAKKITFSFSMGLTSSGCSTGVKFQVLLNGQTQLEHATHLVEWADAQLSLSEFAGETVLLELITDPDGSTHCDGSDWADLLITVEEPEPNGDVNQDGIVNILDMIFVAQSFGQKPPSNPRADVNKDGQVNILDLIFVAERLGENVAAAPAQMDLIKSIPSTSKEIIAIQRALSELEAAVQTNRHIWRSPSSFSDTTYQSRTKASKEPNSSPTTPTPSIQRHGYPISYRKGATVTVKIYDVSGHLVRTIGCGIENRVGYYLTRERSGLLGWSERKMESQSAAASTSTH